MEKRCSHDADEADERAGNYTKGIERRKDESQKKYPPDTANEEYDAIEFFPYCVRGIDHDNLSFLSLVNTITIGPR